MESRRYDSPYRNLDITKIVYGGESVDLNDLKKIQNKNVNIQKNEYKILFGELHCHSSLSDGMSKPEEVFKVLRDEAKLDFGALTDHDHGGVGNLELFGEKWDAIQSLVEKYDTPKKFITILGYEKDAYPWYNNLVVYYKKKKDEMIRGEVDGEMTKEEWIEILNNPNIIAIPHTTSTIGSGADLAKIPLELMPPVMEIYSRWGTSEYFYNPNPVKTQIRGSLWLDVLERGAKVGCIAGSDDHGLKPGCYDNSIKKEGNLRYPYPGITAVLVKEFTREAIFEAIKNRNCYATMGSKILIDFRINNNIMGSELKLEKNKKRTFYINVEAKEDIKTVVLVKNGVDYLVENIEGESNTYKNVHIEYTADRETDYYYLRITQIDGKKAWSSPIWITKQ